MFTNILRRRERADIEVYSLLQAAYSEDRPVVEVAHRSREAQILLASLRNHRIGR